MDLATIEIDQSEAKARLDEYRESLRHDRNAEDEAIARAYRSAARGMPIIRLSEVIHAGGYFSNTGRPRLAIARADATECWLREDWAMSGSRAFVYRDDPEVANRGALVGKHTVRVTVPGERGKYVSGMTMVPPIPPRLRPKPWRIHGFHILWEVEQWQPVPPKDPALVKHIGGDLWSVHAMWDLTELERAVLTGTRR